MKFSTSNTQWVAALSRAVTTQLQIQKQMRRYDKTKLIIVYKPRNFPRWLNLFVENHSIYIDFNNCRNEARAKCVVHSGYVTKWLIHLKKIQNWICKAERVF